MSDPSETRRFEEAFLPHLDAAYNLARWLVRGGAEAEDLVQEAFLRAWKGFAGFRGGDPRGWLLTIVRNACYTWLRQNRRQERAIEFDEEYHSNPAEAPPQERSLEQSASTQMLGEAFEELPAVFREAIVLRGLDGLSYKEISEIAKVPVGTVMSRLARARARLQQCLTARAKKEA